MANEFRCNVCGEHKSRSDAICRYCGSRTWEFAQNEEQPVATKTSRKPDVIEKALMSSAKLMEKTALYKTAMLYAEGIGVEQNLEVAEYLLHEAAQKGSPQAMFAYAQLINNKNPGEAKIWLIKAANHGSPKAKNVLYDNGIDASGQPEGQKRIPETQESLTDVVARVSPFCVEITGASSSVCASSGSGCIIGSDAVVTNAHVVLDDKTGLPHRTVMLDFYKSVRAERKLLRVIAFDRREDVALCAFADAKTNAAGGFPKFADARKLMVGDGVFTIGNALGRGLALSTGVVAKEVESDAYGKSEVLQTDMSINGGNSGGPLFDYSGNIVGLMTFSPVNESEGRAYGVSYAVTSGTIAKLLKQWQR